MTRARLVTAAPGSPAGSAGSGGAAQRRQQRRWQRRDRWDWRRRQGWQRRWQGWQRRPAAGAPGIAGTGGGSAAGCLMFKAPVQVGSFETTALNGPSGMVASRMNPGVIYAQLDTGGPSTIFAATPAGKALGEYALAGVTQMDWEDIAVGPGPGRRQLHLRRRHRRQSGQSHAGADLPGRRALRVADAGPGAEVAQRRAGAALHLPRRGAGRRDVDGGSDERQISSSSPRRPPGTRSSTARPGTPRPTRRPPSRRSRPSPSGRPGGPGRSRAATSRRPAIASWCGRTPPCWSGHGRPPSPRRSPRRRTPSPGQLSRRAKGPASRPTDELCC